MTKNCSVVELLNHNNLKEERGGEGRGGEGKSEIRAKFTLKRHASKDLLAPTKCYLRIVLSV